MSCNVELTEEETLCLHQYFERVDETEDLSFLHPAEYLAFQRIAGQVCKASSAMLESNYNKLLELARHSVAHGATAEWASLKSATCATLRPIQAPTPRVSSPERQLALPDDALAVPSAKPRVEALLRECRAAFETGNLDKAIALFARDARIVSPFRGCETAHAFLPRIFAASGGARLTFHEIRTNVEGRPQALGYFLYDGWRSDPDDAAEDVDVFNVVLNIDAASTGIQSMIILQAASLTHGVVVASVQ